MSNETRHFGRRNVAIIPQHLGEMPEALYPPPGREIPNPAIPILNQSADVRQVALRGLFSSTPYTVSSSGQGTRVLVENPRRMFLFIINLDAAITIYVNYGNPASNLFTPILAGQSRTYDAVPLNSVWLFAASGTPRAVVEEGTA